MNPPEPFGIKGARAWLAQGHKTVEAIEAAGAQLEENAWPNPERDTDLLRLELDACHQEITRLRHILGLVGDALRQGEEA